MAWIRMLDEDEVIARGGRLARLFRAALDPVTGKLDNVLRVHGLRPETLDGHNRLYAAVMREREGLSVREREVIGVAVSAYNQCLY